MPRRTACASRGALGIQPGEVTTTSTSSGSSAVEPGPSRTLGAQHLQKRRLLLVALGVLVERRDLRAEMGQVVGGGEPGHAEAGHDRTDTRPVVAAAESLDTDHEPATHWA